MRKLALSDEILMQIEKPARYIGNELNSVIKDTSQIRFAMCFPDVFSMAGSAQDYERTEYSVVRFGVPGAD